MTINIDKITPRLGAEIQGINLAKPLYQKDIEQIRQAFLDLWYWYSDTST